MNKYEKQYPSHIYPYIVINKIFDFLLKFILKFNWLLTRITKYCWQIDYQPENIADKTNNRLKLKHDFAYLSNGVGWWVVV